MSQSFPRNSPNPPEMPWDLNLTRLVIQIFAEDPRVSFDGSCLCSDHLKLIFFTHWNNTCHYLEMYENGNLQQRVRRIGAVTFCPVARHVSKHDSCSSLFLGSNQKDSNWYQDLGNGGQYAGICLLSDPFFPIQILWGSQRRHLLHKLQIVFANVGQLVHHGFNNW